MERSISNVDHAMLIPERSPEFIMDLGDGSCSEHFIIRYECLALSEKCYGGD
jgi:hypothetical protein